MRKLVLHRREVTTLLTENGFKLARVHGSHFRYEGVVDGELRFPEVDQGLDDYAPERHRPLGNILAQLGFFDDDRPVNHATAWQRFYAGNRRIAKKAQVTHRPWNDPHWAQFYN